MIGLDKFKEYFMGYQDQSVRQAQGAGLSI